MSAVRAAALVALLAAAQAAGAQTMLDQQQRLIDIHCLLLDLPPAEAPAAFRPLELDPGVELITVPPIDGATGSRRQITASDHTPLFPRPRLMLGLPAPEGFRAFAGIAYIPPVTLASVTTDYGALEAGLAYAPGPFSIALRGHAVYAFSRSPVTDPLTRDSLETFVYGADLAGGRDFAVGRARITPYAGLGLVRLHGRFRVSSDGTVLTSDSTVLSLQAGLRVVLAKRFEAVAELDAYPGRLVHANFRLGYLFDLL